MLVQRSALVTRSALHVFDLIEAAEHYPLFLPWCESAQVICRNDELVSADLRVRFAGVSFGMRTRNPKRRPEFMAIQLEQGPFRRFEGQWKLTPLGPLGCRVEFRLEWEFDNSLLSHAAGPLFAHVASTLVDAFVERALAMPQAELAADAAPPPAGTGGAGP
jgi:ribosome-associated toxin RatA of RatAB toxin-antitoxin module